MSTCGSARWAGPSAARTRAWAGGSSGWGPLRMGAGAMPEPLSRVMMPAPPSLLAEAAMSSSALGGQATLTSDLESSNSAAAFKPNNFPS